MKKPIITRDWNYEELLALYDKCEELEARKEQEMQNVTERYHDAIDAYQTANTEIEAIMRDYCVEWGDQMEGFKKEVNSVCRKYKRLSKPLRDLISTIKMGGEQDV